MSVILFWATVITFKPDRCNVSISQCSFGAFSGTVSRLSVQCSYHDSSSEQIWMHSYVLYINNASHGIIFLFSGEIVSFKGL